MIFYWDKTFFLMEKLQMFYNTKKNSIFYLIAPAKWLNFVNKSRKPLWSFFSKKNGVVSVNKQTTILYEPFSSITRGIHCYSMYFYKVKTPINSDEYLRIRINKSKNMIYETTFKTHLLKINKYMIYDCTFKTPPKNKQACSKPPLKINMYVQTPP